MPSDSNDVSAPQKKPKRAPQYGLVITVAGLAALLGASVALLAPVLLGERPPSASPLRAPDAPAGHGKGPLAIDGKLSNELRNFSLKDKQGETVLTVGVARLNADLGAISGNLVRITGGRMEHVSLLLRRGASGKVSLGEVLGKSDSSKSASAPDLDIGPLDVRDIRLTVSLSGSPVVLQIDSASVRVQRRQGQAKPLLFLSDIRGHLISPDPLPQPIALRGGQGVVNLNGSPLVDLRVRGCMGDSELRMRVEVAERHEGADMTLDTEGALAGTAALALSLVAKFKPEKFRVEYGPVEITEPGTCSREHGTALRARIDSDDAPRDDTRSKK